MKKSFEEVRDIVKKFIEESGYSLIRIESIEPDTEREVWTVKIAYGITSTNVKVLEIKDEDGSVVKFQ